MRSQILESLEFLPPEVQSNTLGSGDIDLCTCNKELVATPEPLVGHFDGRQVRDLVH